MMREELKLMANASRKSQVVHRKKEFPSIGNGQVDKGNKPDDPVGRAKGNRQDDTVGRWN